MGKKVLALFLAMLILLLTACDSSDKSEESVPPSSEQSESVLTPEPEPENSPTKTIDELCNSYEEQVEKFFDTCETSYSGHDIVVTVSTSGFAVSLGAIKGSGDDSDWVAVRDELIPTFISNWTTEAKDAGYDDASITFVVQNDISEEEILLKICNDEIIYDAINDDAATLAIPIPETVSYTGSGDSVITLEPFDGSYVFHIAGNQENRHFAVKGYDADGEMTDLFVNTTTAYDGVTVDLSQKTVMLEINAKGDWTIEMQSIYLLDTISSGETLVGTGDSVVIVSNHGDTATISGNAESRHFSVKSHGIENSKLLVNTTDKYEGTVMLSADTVFLEITATGDWSISFD